MFRTGQPVAVQNGSAMIADFSGLRTKMVDGQIRTTDVTSIPLLDALLAVPREAFVPAAKKSLAYIDEDLEIAPGRYLMEPSPFARLVQLAAIRPGDFVLDVGAGTGYSSAVISKLAGAVVALEQDPALAAKAQDVLSGLGCDTVAVVEGPLAAGHPPEAPYDVIMIEGAVERIPDALFEQLKDGGRLIAVEGFGNAAVARIHVKHNGVVSARRAFNAAVKPLPGFHTVAAFEF
jgi:protein-L-isoaspartate(D-aspartate) O-methyltransferase